MDLTGFLTARIAEDAAAARFMMDREAAGLQPRADFLGFPLGERMRREVEAKRKILAEHRPYDTTDGPPPQRCYVCASTRAYRSGAAIQEEWPCPTVRALAAVWSDHPDYDPAWKET